MLQSKERKLAPQLPVPNSEKETAAKKEASEVALQQAVSPLNVVQLCNPVATAGVTKEVIGQEAP